MERLAQAGQLAAFQHDRFWQPMDTLRDRNMLEELWQSGRAEWNVWAHAPAPAVTAPELETMLAAPLAEPAARSRAMPLAVMPSD